MVPEGPGRVQEAQEVPEALPSPLAVPAVVRATVPEVPEGEGPITGTAILH